MKIRDKDVTIAAAALGVGAVAIHHVSEGSMDPTMIALAKSETARGIAFGAGGGAAVGIVTKASVMEILGRIFVGGLMAAVAAPWIAAEVLQVPTSSTSYPVLCCSIGVLGYQIVHQIIRDPGSIPIVGKVLGPIVAGANSAAGGQVAMPAPIPPSGTSQPQATPPIKQTGPATDGGWTTMTNQSPPEAIRPNTARAIRVPLAR